MTDWISVIRGDLDRALGELPAEQLEELTGHLLTFQLRAERRLRGLAVTPASDAQAPVSATVISAALGVPPGAVREWARSGRVPCERYGRFVRFRLAAVKAALAANSKPARLEGAKKPTDGNGSQHPPTGHLPPRGGA